ncbi:putative FtsJ cell division protein [Spironucleus salmonicida]|uniref:FtsJ cell division protein n=1 Tax=Spironucleus salmonicida TaxID=348837 RepID=V6LSC1_9EUKA|nr:putative FtsJ cell division protein [Spironucleus salmonicida]|eukprot:EST46596.1 Ribosomal RNA methyltransferase [Spironucleus salmonicida]
MQGRHSKLGKGRKDMYYYLAKETGYRSRAAFKLLQLEKKYGFLSDSKTCLDLCAAPGGWSQVAVKHMPVGSRVIAVDLDPIKDISGVTAFQGDITTETTSNQINKILNGAMIDVCVHDGAPNASGDYGQDSYIQNILVLWALKLAIKHLKKGGTFVTKIFRNSEFLQLQYVFKQLFDKVETTKPKSSRDTSAEIFTVCQGFKNVEIDEKMLDPDVVLKVEKQEKVENLKGLVQKLDLNTKHRTGYDDELTKKYFDVLSFVISPSPIGLLAKAGEICFTDDISTDYRFKPLVKQIEGDGVKFNKRIINSIQEYNRIQELIKQLVPSEVGQLLQDVKVLSKRDLRILLKWRETVLSEVCAQTAINEVRQVAEFEEEEVQEDLNPAQKQEKALQDQIISREKQAVRQDKRTIKKQAKKLATFDGENVDDMASMYLRKDLFTIKQATAEFREGEICADQDQSDSDINDPSRQKIGHDIEVNIDADQEQYLDQVDENLDFYYTQYADKRQKRENRLKELEEMERKAKGHADIRTAAEEWFKQREFVQEAEKSQNSEDFNTSDEEFANQFPLPRDLLSRTKAHEKRVKMIAKQAKELAKSSKQLDALKDEHRFGDVGITATKDFENMKKAYGITKETGLGEIEILKKGEAEEEEDVYEDEIEDVLEAETEALDEEVPKFKEASLGKQLSKGQIEATATKIALASCMTHRKRRRELEESGYNRHTFYLDDGDQLPKWFQEDEKKHCQPIRPLNSDEIQQIKQKLQDMQTQPRTKKEREAIARKKVRTNQAYTAVQEKTQQIINREDLTEREKVKQLKSVQSKLQQKQQKKRVVYSNIHKDVASTAKSNRNTIYVDKRGKKDLRQEKIRKRRGY